jgi:TPR repeat protein
LNRVTRSSLRFARWITSFSARSVSEALCALALFICLGATAAGAETRVALVIGNAAYANVPPLANPANDAEDVTEALEDLEFRVFTGIDLDLAEMRALLADFSMAAQTADVALFYYAGHAFQVNAENFLLPVELRLTDAEEVVDQTLPLAEVIAALQDSSGIRLIFLDACRDNPLGLDGARGTAEGLARIGSSVDFLISYATQPGAVAFDGDARNGTFTEAVLSHIQTPGQTLADMMIAVRRDVISASGGQQIPWENTSLTRQFVFNEGPVLATAETLFFQVAARTQDPDLMALYVERYPEGAHVRDAAGFIESGAIVRSAEAVEGAEEDLWLLVRQTRMRELAARYLDLYPGGRHQDAARRMLETLPSQADLGDGQLCEALATHPRDATANTAGVPFARLARNASLAIEVCARAADAFPRRPHFTALLARAQAAAGQREEAVRLYRDAAARGDLRAMVSLALLMETGDGVAQDLAGAMALYERAAAGGSADAAINLAVALYEGRGVPEEPQRAVELLARAAQGGSPIATFNLGVLTQSGVTGSPEDAFDLFRRAARDGEPRGYRAAAVLLDEGRGVPADPEAAADLLLRGAAADTGEIVAELGARAGDWRPDTIRAVQERLRAAGLYGGEIDGSAGPLFAEALRLWRNGGFDVAVLAN